MAITSVAQPGVALSNVLVATFTEPDASDSSAEYTATINWGDGTESAGAVYKAGGVYKVFGSHEFTTAENFAAQVTIAQAWQAQTPEVVIGLLISSLGAGGKNAPQNSVTINVGDPFNNNNKDLFFKLSVSIDNNKMSVKVLEQPGIQNLIDGQWNKNRAPADKYKLPFDAIVAGAQTGSNEDWMDTDSLQVATRWAKGDKMMAQTTNAVKQGVRDTGADWSFDHVASPNETATVSDTVADGPTKMNIVFVYTDVIWGPPSGSTAADLGQDLPLIIGSISGTKNADGTWKLQVLPGDVTKLTGGYPKPRVYSEIIETLGKTLAVRTGYELVARPTDLLPGNEQKSKVVEALIEAAVKNKTINSTSDTGYDIKRE